MIQVKYREGADIELEISGHSGYAPMGQDLICAAATILGRTFVDATAAENKIAAGYLYARCSLKKRKQARAVVCGFAILAKQYPDNVCMVE